MVAIEANNEFNISEQAGYAEPILLLVDSDPAVENIQEFGSCALGLRFPAGTAVLPLLASLTTVD